MYLTEKKHRGLCLAVGAGAIGKSVTGYIFQKHGYDVVFADVIPEVIHDINYRNGYIIQNTQTGKRTDEVIVRGVSAYSVVDPEVNGIAIHADYICTSVGAKGLKSLLPVIINWIKNRDTENPKRLFLMLFENDAECSKILTESIIANLGVFPEWLVISKTSIERMTKIEKNSKNEYNAVAEQFIPVIVSKKQFVGTDIERMHDSFLLVDDIEAYYSRKLYTNNLGHAVLGYMGTYLGYEDTVQAMNDPMVYRCLTDVLDESSRMLTCRYGFTKAESGMHIKAILERYQNENFRDSLHRLSRDPVRKLGKNERIVGAIIHCSECGIDPWAIIHLLFYVLVYKDEDDPSVRVLNDILAEQGIEGVLSRVCGLKKESELFDRIIRDYSNLTFPYDIKIL